MLGSRGPGFVSVICPSPCRIPGGRPKEQGGCKEAGEGPGMIVVGAQVVDGRVWVTQPDDAAGDAALRVRDAAVRVGDAAVRVGRWVREK